MIAEPIVEIKGVHKYYGDLKQRVIALENINLSVHRGELLALSGPSGSGKTTLLNLAGALDKPDLGEVLILGRALSTLNQTEMTLLRRNTLGFIFQSYNLIPVMTALENASFILSLKGFKRQEALERARNALALLGLSGLESRFPNQLSGGQQQRVAVARAMAAEPALLYADEPTANLDAKNAEEFLNAIQRLNRDNGLTFVFATHDPKVINRAKRVVTLADGRIIDDRDV